CPVITRAAWRIRLHGAPSGAALLLPPCFIVTGVVSPGERRHGVVEGTAVIDALFFDVHRVVPAPLGPTSALTQDLLHGLQQDVLVEGFGEDRVGTRLGGPREIGRG